MVAAAVAEEGAVGEDDGAQVVSVTISRSATRAYDRIRDALRSNFHKSVALVWGLNDSLLL